MQAVVLAAVHVEQTICNPDVLQAVKKTIETSAVPTQELHDLFGQNSAATRVRIVLPPGAPPCCVAKQSSFSFCRCIHPALGVSIPALCAG